MISENVVGFKCIRCEKEWSLKQVKKLRGTETK